MKIHGYTGAMIGNRMAFSSRDALTGLGLSLVACAVYLGSLNVGFFSDDFYFLARTGPILENPLHLFHIYFRDFIPVVHFSFLIDWFLGGMSPTMYHLSSILIHGITTFLIFTLCRSLKTSTVIATAATLCWAFNVHISETVIWSAARGHSLATLFLVATLISVARDWRLRWSVVLFLFALGAKETALFPVVLLPFLATGRRKQMLTALIFGLISIAFVLFNIFAKPQLYLAKGNPFDFIFQAAFLLLRPLGLDRFYDHSIPALIVVALVFAGLVAVMRHQPIGLTGLGWIAASLVPIALQPVYSSRYFYLPTVGFALVLCALVQIGSRALSSKNGQRFGLGFGILLLALTITTNIVFIQREITDYSTLSRPFDACVEHLRSSVNELKENETLVILDVSKHTTIAELTKKIGERPTLQKLIPYRQHGIDGLIAIDDLINIVKPLRSGQLARSRDPLSCSPDHIVVYDGERAWTIPEMPRVDFPPERTFACTWGEAAAYFDQEQGHE